MEITITGEARTTVAPEMATVTLRIESEHRDQVRARRDVESLTGALIAELEAMPREELAHFHTDGLRTWSFKRDGDRNATHTAACTVDATFVDFAKMSEHTSRWAGKGIEIGYTQWKLTDEQRRANLHGLVAEALDAARTKAEAIAGHLGAGVVTVEKVTDQSMEAPMARMAFGAAFKQDAGPIEARPEDIELSTSLTVLFRAE